MNQRRTGILMVTAVLACAVTLGGCPAFDPHTRAGTLPHDGLKRTFLVHTPPNYEELEKLPLVLVLHGGGGNGRRIMRQTGFNALADREGFIAVYPDGYLDGWNDGRGANPELAAIDDTGFLRALVTHLTATYPIDSARVYVTGPSNGGMMTHRMACACPDLFAAAAPVIANMPENLADACTPAEPVTMLIMNGTDDPWVLWEGGPVVPGGQDRGTVLSVDDTVALWADRNGCTVEGEVEWLEDTDPNDGTRVWRKACTGGTGGSSVVLYGIEGGGHAWPGGTQYLPRSVIGAVCQDIDATQVIWDFFKSHSKP